MRTYHGKRDVGRRRAVGDFQLVPGDIEILQHVYSHRLLRIDNLALLTCRSDKALARRLRKLTQRKFLHHYRPTIPKHVYTLGKAAIPILVGQGMAPPDLLGRRIRNELNDLFLKHETMIAEFHVLLTLASQNNSTKLVDWREGTALHDHVSFSENGAKRKLPIRPDAFFTMQDSRAASKQPAHFFLESDRSTTTLGRFQDKITGYRHYFDQSRHKAKYGIRNFRVLTLAISIKRARNLCELAEKNLPSAARQFYLFGCLNDLSPQTPEAIFTRQFITPKDYRTGSSHYLI